MYPIWQTVPRDGTAQKAIRSEEALYSRASYRLGPVPDYVSTYPGSGLTPQRIANINNQVLTTGYMLDKACLDEQVYLRDTHLASVDHARRVVVTGQEMSVEPAFDDDLSQQLADYTFAWVSDVTNWPSAMYELGWANLAGYAIQESYYGDGPREMSWTTTYDGKRQSLSIVGPHPQELFWVSNVHSRFEPQTDQLLLDTGGEGMTLPPWKYIVHYTTGNLQKRRRGYMWQVIWMHLLKQQALMRWGVVLDVWGIPIPIGKAAVELWQDEKRKQEMINMLQAYGLGQPALFTEDFEVTPSPEITAGDSRGMHVAITTFCNTEMSKMIQGQTLTTEASGTGSYNMSETHAQTKESFARQDERALSETVRGFFRAVIRLNLDQLSEKLGATPQEILRRIPIPHWQVERALTPTAQWDIVQKAVNELRLPVDRAAIMRRFALPVARTKDAEIKGKTEIIQEGAVASSTMEAGEGTKGQSSAGTGGGA